MFVIVRVKCPDGLIVNVTDTWVFGPYATREEADAAVPEEWDMDTAYDWWVNPITDGNLLSVQQTMES